MQSREIFEYIRPQRERDKTLLNDLFNYQSTFIF